MSFYLHPISPELLLSHPVCELLTLLLLDIFP